MQIKKILNKHTLSLASNAVMPIMGMISVSLLARIPPADFGNWILFLMSYTIANFSRSGFMQTSLIKFCTAANPDRKLNVIGSTWMIALAMATLLGLACFIVHMFVTGSPATEVIIKWFAIIFLATVPSSVALWILQAEERFGQIFILQFIGQITFFVSIIVLLVFDLKHFEDVIYAYAISAILTSLFSIVSGWCKIHSIAHQTWACIKQLMNFGKFTVATSISSYLLRASDTFIIKFMFVNPAVVGVYYLPQRLMEVIEIPLRSFIATALPAMSAAVQRHDQPYMTHIMKKYAGILTLLLVPVSLVGIIFADLIIDIIGGAHFAHTDAANVFRIFMSFAILMPIDRFFGITLDILNKPHFNMIKVILMLVVNVVGDFIGIYLTHNLYGVALSSIFTFLAGIVYGYWVLRRHLHFKLRDIFKLGFSEIQSIIGDILARITGRAEKKTS